MANWCYNTVWFTGEPDVINSLTCFLYELAQEGQRTGEGQLPGFISKKEGWMFELGWSGEFHFYTTKWKPNTNVLIEVADRYGLDFRHAYEETGNGIFGISAYEKGVLRTTALDPEDFEAYVYNENTDTYEFENEHYESSDVILQNPVGTKICHPNFNDMKIINLKLYSFNELDKAAREKALVEYSDLNVGFDWWNDQYDDFVGLCSYLGIVVDKQSIRFSGFYSQGDGSTFTATVDIPQLIAAIQTEA